MPHNGLEGPRKQPRAQGVSPESLCLVLYQPRGNPNTLTGGLQEDKGGSVCSSQAAAAVDRGFAVISCSFVGHCGPGRDDDCSHPSADLDTPVLRSPHSTHSWALRRYYSTADLLLQQHCSLACCEDGQVDKRFDLERKKAVCETAQTLQVDVRWWCMTPGLDGRKVGGDAHPWTGRFKPATATHFNRPPHSHLDIWSTIHSGLPALVI